MNIQYSISNIKKLYAEDALDCKLIENDFGISGFPLIVSYQHGVGEPDGSHLEVAELIDKLFLEKDIKLDKNLFSPQYVSSLAWAAPNTFIKNYKILAPYLTELSYYNFCSLYRRSEVVKHILNNIEHYEQYLFSKSLASMVLFLVASVSHKIVNINEESNIIQRFLLLVREKFQYSSNRKIIVQFLEKRIKNLNSKPIEFQNKVNSKIALFITGQLRSYEEALPKILNQIAGDKLNTYTIYIATWDSIGRPDIDGFRLNRFFTQETVEYIKNELDIDNVVKCFKDKYYNEVSSIELLNKITENFEFKNIIINKENQYPFNLMINSEKMYFNNAYWILTLGKDFFKSNFDYGIKIRPDQHYDYNFNFEEFRSRGNSINQEFPGGYEFREWGFGIGDQIFHSPINSFIEIMTLHNDQLIKSVLSELFEMPPFMGHVSVAFSMYLNNYQINQTPLGTPKFLPYKLLDIDNFKKIYTDLV